MDSYAQLFSRFYLAQDASPLFHNPFSPYEHGEIVFPMNNDILKNPFNMDSPNYLSCIYLKKAGKEYGFGKALINIDVFYHDGGRIRGNFSNPKAINEQEFKNWLSHIDEEFERVSIDRQAQPHWYKQ